MSCTRTVSQGEEVEGGCKFKQGKVPGGYSHGPGPGPKRPRTSDGGPALKTTRSQKAAAGRPP